MDTARAETGTKALILDVALRRFADHGYHNTSLNEIADEVGIRRPSLLHHFPSKDALYRAVLLDAFADWLTLVEDAVAGPQRQGWPQVERVLRAAFRFFEEHPEFVRLARWEALYGGPMLSRGAGPDPPTAVRPGHASSSSGRWSRGDCGPTTPRQLLLTGYGAVLTYLSDAPLITSLLDEDPLSPRMLATRREHVIDVLRNALEP